MELCGTPDKTDLGVDLTLFTQTDKSHCCNQEDIQLVVWGLIPKLFSLTTSLGCDTTSKAFEKSSTATLLQQGLCSSQ